MKFSFREKVFSVVKKIPKGKTMTYKTVAQRVGKPGAARAVGSILKTNFNKAIPCHRVIRSDGQMGGYNRGGSLAKRAILKKEGAIH
jgi:O-6-methylguanine DNA methyltransferase